MSQRTKIIGCIALLLLPTVGVAGASPPDDPRVVAYAKEVGRSKTEAKRMLGLQDVAGDLQAEISRLMPEILGGFYIEHVPRFQVIVQLTDGDRALIEPLLSGRLNSLRPFLRVEHVQRSLHQLEATRREIASWLNEADIRADLDIDIRENLVTVNAIDPMNLYAALAAAGRSLPTGSKAQAVRELTKPLAGIAGGLSITQCTSGFSVIHPDGRRGIATAAHCDNNQQYYQGTFLPWVYGVTGGDWDVQWHSTPGYTPTNLVWNGVNYVSITGLTYRGSQFVGEFVCKNGRVTGYGCGYIRSTTFAPSSISNPNATWVTVGSSTIYGEGGDSGAPFWKGSSAYGILHGIYYDYGYGEYRLVYMPIDGVANGLGVYVLVSP